MKNMYGKAPLPAPAIKGSFDLSNGMYCVCGTTDEGICVDVYRNKSMKELVSMQHGITISPTGLDGNTFNKDGIKMLKNLIESMAYEFD